MSGRTPEERERARLERERRRALERGEEPPPVPAPRAAPEPPPRAAGPDSAAAAPEPVAAGSVAPPRTPAPRRVIASPPDPGEDQPIGTVRPQAQAGAPGMPQRPITVPRRRRGPGRIVFLAAIAAILALLAGWLLLSTFNPGKGDGEGEVVVNVPKGSSAGQIGDLLAERGVVGSAFFFSLRATLSGDRENLRAGRYTLRRDMSNAAALEVLTAPPATAKTISLVIPEGPSRREVAPFVKDAGIEGSYLEASERSTVLDPRDYGAPRAVKNLEGFLFPATYELRSGASAKKLVNDQLRAFKANFGTVSLRAAKRRNLTAYDVLIIASMIERETAVAKERRLVASVIYNRLRRDIPLGIDATTRYAENNWTRPLKVSELERDSPFNTRRNQGLPPTPIGNPGLASIRAAANPAATSYLFYVVKACGNGAHNFSRTDAEFQRDVAAYDAKRKELGGKDPSQC